MGVLHQKTNMLVYPISSMSNDTQKFVRNVLRNSQSLQEAIANLKPRRDEPLPSSKEDYTVDNVIDGLERLQQLGDSPRHKTLQSVLRFITGEGELRQDANELFNRASERPGTKVYDSEN